MKAADYEAAKYSFLFPAQPLKIHQTGNDPQVYCFYLHTVVLSVEVSLPLSLHAAAAPTHSVHQEEQRLGGFHNVAPHFMPKL